MDTDIINQPLGNQLFPFQGIVEQLTHGKRYSRLTAEMAVPLHLLRRQGILQEEQPVRFQLLGQAQRLNGGSDSYAVPFVVDNTLPELTLDHQDGSTWYYTNENGYLVLTGRVYDEGTAQMEQAGIHSVVDERIFGNTTSQKDNIVMVQVGDDFYRATIEEDGTFTVRIPDSGQTIHQATVYYGDHFLPVGSESGWSDAEASTGFAPDRLSYVVNDQADTTQVPWMYQFAYRAANMDSIAVNLALQDPAPTVSVSGPEVATNTGWYDYIFNLSGVAEFDTLHLVYTVDDPSGVINGNNPVALNGFVRTNFTSTTNADGSVTYEAILVYDPASAEAPSLPVDVFNMSLRTADEGSGSVTVKLDGATCAYQGGSAVTVEVDEANGSVTTQVTWNVYDVNGDGAVDIGDVSAVRGYYQVKEGDANWDAAKICDVNGDGTVDMEDLVEVGLAVLNADTAR